jgi:hypothetical protein
MAGAADGAEPEPSAGLQGYLSLGLQFRQDLLVELGGGNHGNGPEVLRGGPEHGGPPYVYLLYGLLLRGAARDRLLEGIEVYADQVDGAYAVLDELGDVAGVLEVREDAAVDLRVEGLDPPAQDLRLARHLRDRDDGNAVLFERPRRPSGRDDLEPQSVQPAREGSDTPLVRDRDERPALHTLPQK